MVTATISSTSTSPPSRICMAASMAWVSKGFRFFSPERSRRFELESMRFSTAASGTSLTRTQIFKGVSFFAVPCGPAVARIAVQATRRRGYYPVDSPVNLRSLGTAGLQSLLGDRHRGRVLDGLPLDLALAHEPERQQRPGEGQQASEQEDLVQPGEEPLACHVRRLGPRSGGHARERLVQIAGRRSLDQLPRAIARAGGR